MKVKLLKRLRKEIISNADILWFSQWSGVLYTHLCGKKYYGSSHSPIGLGNPNIAGKELEHIALKGYLSSKKNKKNKIL